MKKSDFPNFSFLPATCKNLVCVEKRKINGVKFILHRDSSLVDHTKGRSFVTIASSLSGIEVRGVVELYV